LHIGFLASAIRNPPIPGLYNHHLLPANTFRDTIPEIFPSLAFTISLFFSAAITVFAFPWLNKKSLLFSRTIRGKEAESPCPRLTEKLPFLEDAPAQNLPSLAFTIGALRMSRGSRNFR